MVTTNPQHCDSTVTFPRFREHVATLLSPSLHTIIVEGKVRVFPRSDGYLIKGPNGPEECHGKERWFSAEDKREAMTILDAPNLGRSKDRCDGVVPVTEGVAPGLHSRLQE